MPRAERWFKNAIVYAVSVEHFFDADGDGVGDLRGLERRLDHLVSLGVTCVWLLPFQTSPRRDFGYDVADHYAVDPRFGHLGDFALLVRNAGQRGLRVIVDLSLQHTSVDHAWFRAAREDRGDGRHGFYVWADEPQEPTQDTGPITWEGDEPTTWTFDERAGRWYRHRFYAHEPDVNPLDPALRDELHRVLTFWLQQGVDGVRIDAGSHLSRDAAQAFGGDEVAFLRELRGTAALQSPDGVLMVEADVEPERLGPYLSGTEGGVLLFNFVLSSHLFLGLARESGEPVADALRRMPAASASGQWANFLRNHDELDLERLTGDERDEVFAAFAPEPGMRIFGRGIRRRIGPMLGGDGPRLRLAYNALLSLPGSPVLLWGDELPLGEDLSRPDREPVRTPMSWTDAAQARRDQHSLLNWLAAAIRARREAAHIGWGTSKVLDCRPSRVLALRHDWEEESVVILSNFAAGRCDVELGGCGDLADVVETFADRDYGDDGGELASPVPLEGFGYRWFRGRLAR